MGRKNTHTTNRMLARTTKLIEKSNGTGTTKLDKEITPIARGYLVILATSSQCKCRYHPSGPSQSRTPLPQRSALGCSHR